MTGMIEKFHINTRTFDEQYRNFEQVGFAYDPQGDNDKIVFNRNLYKDERLHSLNLLILVSKFDKAF